MYSLDYTHFSALAWRIPGTGEPGGLLSMGSHRVGHDWNDLAAAAAALDYSKWKWNSPGQNTGVSSCSLLQGIFSAQGSNPGFSHWWQILYQLSPPVRLSIVKTGSEDIDIFWGSLLESTNLFLKGLYQVKLWPLVWSYYMVVCITYPLPLKTTGR